MSRGPVSGGSVSTAGFACGYDAGGAIVYDLPQLPVIPPQQLVNGATAGIIKPDHAALGSDEQAALVEHGRYLFTIGPCALCHGNDGSGGLNVSSGATEPALPGV